MSVASPRVTITSVSTGARSTGRMTTRSIRTPATNAMPSVSGNATQKLIPWVMSVNAMKVANIAISPWAKLTRPMAL